MSKYNDKEKITVLYNALQDMLQLHNGVMQSNNVGKMVFKIMRC